MEQDRIKCLELAVGIKAREGSTRTESILELAEQFHTFVLKEPAHHYGPGPKGKKARVTP